MTGRHRARSRAHPASATTSGMPARQPAAEVGGAVWADVERAEDHVVVRLDGTLSRSTAPQVGSILDILLSEGRPVLVELARLRLGWAPGLEVFPIAQRAGGGWPVARMVLFAADEDLAPALRAAGVAERMPVVPDRSAATARRNQRPETVRRHVNLLNRPVSARSARHAAEAACHDWHITHLAPAVARIAGELVTNAVEHTDGGAELTLDLHGSAMTVGVKDGLAGSRPRPQLSCVGTPCGRGLQVVTSLATRWGVTQHDDGKTVWAELSIDGPAPRPPHDEEVPDDGVR